MGSLLTAIINQILACKTAATEVVLKEKKKLSYVRNGSIYPPFT